MFTILSVFDNRYGPRLFLKAPNLKTSIHLDHIPLLMDLFKEGFFVYEFGDLKTANLIFEIWSPLARGKKELLMITIGLYQGEYNLNLNSFQEIMEYFAVEFQNIKDLYKGFHHNHIPGGSEKYNEIIDFVLSFYESLPKESEIIKQNLAKILTYGLSQSGKNSIINSLQEKISQSRQGIEAYSMLDRFKL